MSLVAGTRFMTPRLSGKAWPAVASSHYKFQYDKWWEIRELNSGLECHKLSCYHYTNNPIFKTQLLLHKIQDSNL